MFVWIACRLPEDYEAFLRSHCHRLNTPPALDTVAFLLPQHISLKISFDAGAQTDAVVSFLDSLLRRESPFRISLQGPQLHPGLLWLPAAESSELSRLHALLDRELEAHFGIPQHPFDKCFRFHSTLFLSSDQDRLGAMHAQLSALPLQRSLPIDSFLIGVSETGQPGSYRVLRCIPAAGAAY